MWQFIEVYRLQLVSVCVFAKIIELFSCMVTCNYISDYIREIGIFSLYWDIAKNIYKETVLQGKKPTVS